MILCQGTVERNCLKFNHIFAIYGIGRKEGKRGMATVAAARGRLLRPRTALRSPKFKGRHVVFDYNEHMMPKMISFALASHGREAQYLVDQRREPKKPMNKRFLKC